jgi:hypothetical protein
MTPHQKTAITHPCYFATETNHPRYHHSFPNGTVVLTVNSGYE